mmetsp:Transcript_29727/g.76267  ORF Transcript_29727/g.76267 Transcript_29727/m.76267 type:complete len:493 (+) Transcript_29727:1961-3439(+)
MNACKSVAHILHPVHELERRRFGGVQDGPRKYQQKHGDDGREALAKKPPHLWVLQIFPQNARWFWCPSDFQMYPVECQLRVRVPLQHRVNRLAIRFEDGVPVLWIFKHHESRASSASRELCTHSLGQSVVCRLQMRKLFGVHPLPLALPDLESLQLAFHRQLLHGCKHSTAPGIRHLNLSNSVVLRGVRYVALRIQLRIRSGRIHVGGCVSLGLLRFVACCRAGLPRGDDILKMTLELALESNVDTLQTASSQLGISLALSATRLASRRPLRDVGYDDSVIRRSDVGLVVQLHRAAHADEPVPDAEGHQDRHGESVQPPAHGGDALDGDILPEQSDVAVVQGVLDDLRWSSHREVGPRPQISNRGLGERKHNPRREHRPGNIRREERKSKQGHHRKCHSQIFHQLEIQLDSDPELTHIRCGSPQHRPPPEGLGVRARASCRVPIGGCYHLLVQLSALGLQPAQLLLSSIPLPKHAFQRVIDVAFFAETWPLR